MTSIVHPPTATAADSQTTTPPCLSRRTGSVSVVIPCYNGRRYLARCLDSVLAAADGLDDVVVVDDGSTEPIRDLVERYAPLVRYIHQENAGPGAARTRGIQVTTGRYIRFVDADDWLLNAADLAAQVAMLESYPNVGLVYGRAQNVDRDGRPLDMRGPAFARGDYVRDGWAELEDLLFDNYIPTSSVIVRRSVAERVGAFRVDYATAQDWEYWLRLARAADVGFVDRPVIAYRVHQAGITGRKTVDEWLRIRTEILDSLFLDPLAASRLGHLCGAVSARVDIGAAALAYVRGERKRARGHAAHGLVRAIQHHRGRDALEALDLLARASVPAAARDRLRAARSRLRAWRAADAHSGVTV